MPRFAPNRVLSCANLVLMEQRTARKGRQWKARDRMESRALEAHDHASDPATREHGRPRRDEAFVKPYAVTLGVLLLGAVTALSVVGGAIACVGWLIETVGLYPTSLVAALAAGSLATAAWFGRGGGP